MTYREYRTVDKSQWKPGPWQNEPDKIQFKDEDTGLSCLIVRGPVGSLCGYVGVVENHPLYKQDGDQLECHGGVTFTGFCQTEADPSHGICHLPDPGEPDHVWWFGFDCAHVYDKTPGALYESSWPHNVYRDIEYVKNEIKKLAKQLKGETTHGEIQ